MSIYRNQPTCTSGATMKNAQCEDTPKARVDVQQAETSIRLVQGLQPAQPEREPQLSIWINNLKKQIDYIDERIYTLTDSITALNDKLHPIIRSEPEVASVLADKLNNKEGESLVLFAEVLRAFTVRLNDIGNSIHNQTLRIRSTQEKIEL